MRKALGLAVALFFIASVIGIVLSIFMLRSHLMSSDYILQSQKDQVPMLTAVLVALQIKVMNFIYEKIATYLNSWENYKT